MGWEGGRGRGRGLLAWRLISSSLWYNTVGGGGGGFEEFLGGEPNFGSKGTVGLFLWQITSHREDHVFLNL